jgi:hypothetical protein
MPIMIYTPPPPIINPVIRGAAFALGVFAFVALILSAYLFVSAAAMVLT